MPSLRIPGHRASPIDRSDTPKRTKQGTFHLGGTESERGRKGLLKVRSSAKAHPCCKARCHIPPSSPPPNEWSRPDGAHLQQRVDDDPNGVWSVALLAQHGEVLKDGL